MSRKTAAGENLWLSLYRADTYTKQAAAIRLGKAGMTVELATKRWLEGMARHLQESFPGKLRIAREGLGITQLELSEIAQLSVTGLAMVERGERTPNLDTAARICWALDVASCSAARPVS
jgi:DNA-binding XRE family transcriptional regulator